MSFNVKTALLHTKLSTIIYCKQIPGFPEAEPSIVLHLLVALYSLCQSSYEFYMLLHKLMTHLGMSHCKIDHAVFYGHWTTLPNGEHVRDTWVTNPDQHILAAVRHADGTFSQQSLLANDSMSPG